VEAAGGAMTEIDERRKGEVLIVTGMSGAGRTTVANALEDLDWYVVDNLPAQMLVHLVGMLTSGPPGTRAERVADQPRRKERQALRKQLGLKPDPLALDAEDDGLQAGERDVVADAAREKAAQDRPDPLLREAATILADATALLAQDKQLAAAVLPATGRAMHWAE